MLSTALLMSSPSAWQTWGGREGGRKEGEEGGGNEIARFVETARGDRNVIWREGGREGGRGEQSINRNRK